MPRSPSWLLFAAPIVELPNGIRHRPAHGQQSERQDGPTSIEHPVQEYRPIPAGGQITQVMRTANTLSPWAGFGVILLFIAILCQHSRPHVGLIHYTNKRLFHRLGAEGGLHR
jgi:hypothetical protein